MPGIDIWEKIRKKKLPSSNAAERLEQLLGFLRSLSTPKNGVDVKTWEAFIQFVQHASTEDLSRFISCFEWSTHQLGANDLVHEINQQVRGRTNSPQAEQIYPRLFLHVAQLLSTSGEKTLDLATLEGLFKLPKLPDADLELLRSLNTEVLSHSVRLDQLESMTQRHEAAIAEIRRHVLTNEYGVIPSPRLSSALDDISTSLPPQVNTVVLRQKTVAEFRDIVLNHEWISLYGSVGSGKTQFASLLGDQLAAIVYISLRDLNSHEANFLLHHVFRQLSKNEKTGSVTNAGLTALDVGATIILDDLPRLMPGDKLCQRLVQIADTVSVRNQTLLTLSHHPIPNTISSHLHRARFCEELIPSFNSEEIMDLFVHHGADRNLISPHIAASFAQSTSGNPTLLSALARTLASRNWEGVEDQRNETALSASTGELIEDTMFRLLQTVESPDARELLYRLCIVAGFFSSTEVEIVSAVSPTIARSRESYTSLQGLWVEKQSSNLAAVCPLVSQFGAAELDQNVAVAVANSLAHQILGKHDISPIDFSKAINYLRKAKNGPLLGLHLLKGLEAAGNLPVAWKKILFFMTTAEDILDECPTVLALLIRARQLILAHELGMSTEDVLRESYKLIERVTAKEQWAVVGYTTQVIPILANTSIDDAIILCRFYLEHIDEVLEFRKTIADDISLARPEQFASSFPWFVVTGLRTSNQFMQWFELLEQQSNARFLQIFDCDLAPDGFKLALDNLWMTQYELPDADRAIAQIVRVYPSGEPQGGFALAGAAR